jgi:hypothetical protein
MTEQRKRLSRCDQKVRGRNAGLGVLHRGLTRPPVSRRDLTDPVIDAERGKPDLLR